MGWRSFHYSSIWQVEVHPSGSIDLDVVDQVDPVRTPVACGCSILWFRASAYTDYVSILDILQSFHKSHPHRDVHPRQEASICGAAAL